MNLLDFKKKKFDYNMLLMLNQKVIIINEIKLILIKK